MPVDDPGYDGDSVGSTPRRRQISKAKERVQYSDIVEYQKLAALPRPSMPGDPPTINGTRVGRFRLDLHDYEQWQGDVADRVALLGEEALVHRERTGEVSTDERTSKRVLDMGRQAFSLTKAVAYDTRSKAAAIKARQTLAEAGLMTPVPVSRGGGVGSRGSSSTTAGGLDLVSTLAPPGQIDAPGLLDISDEDGGGGGNMSSEDEYAQQFMLDGLDTRTLYNGGMNPAGENEDKDLDSDEDWDTTEWGKEDVEQACVALLDEVETAATSKRHRLATMMLVKLVNKHDTAVDYLDGGMESLLEKGLRMQHHGITLASKNLTLVLAKVAAVSTLAERMSAMSAVIKCVNCTNAVLNLAASVVQLRFRYRRYIHGRGLHQSVEVRARNKMIMLQRIVDQSAKFREVRMSPNGGEIPDENLEAYIELLSNMTRPTHKRADRDCSLIRRHGGMLTLIRAIEYSDARSVRAIACQAIRHLCMQDGMTLHLLRAGAAQPLGGMLQSKSIEDRNDGLEVLDLLAQRCFVTEKEMRDRDDVTLHWRDVCRSCGARCGKQCKRPEYEASRYVGSEEIYEILLASFMIHSNAPTRIGSLMILHKLASGPGTIDLATILCLGAGVRRRPGILRVQAIRGRGLPNADDYSAMDPYVKCTLVTPHQPNMETGRDKQTVGKTMPALEAGMHPTWNITEHKSIMDLKYDAPLPMTEEDKKIAEHAAWLLGNEDGLCTNASLHVEVVDFDFVGDHDEVSHLHLDVTDQLNKAPLISKEMWHIMTPPPVDLRMGDEPPKPHFGRFGTGGQLRLSLQFIPNGAGARRRTSYGPPSEWRERGKREKTLELEERKAREKLRQIKRIEWQRIEEHRLANKQDDPNEWMDEEEEEGAAELKFEQQLEHDVPEPTSNDRPVSLENLIACMQSTEPGEAAIALATFQQLCYGTGGATGCLNRERLISAGALELLLPLCFDSTCEMNREPPALEVMNALKSVELKNSFVSAPLSCDDDVFLRSLSALVCLAGSPIRRRTEVVDITQSLKEVADDVRRDLMFMLLNHTRTEVDFYLKKTHNGREIVQDDRESNREGPAGLRLLSIGALPFVLRFLIMGETLGEDPNEIEEAYGGYLKTDQFIRMHGYNGSSGSGIKSGVDDGTGDLFQRRTERRRISAIIIHRLMQASSISCIIEGVATMTAKEVTGALFLPSIVYFLTMVVQENRLSQLSGEAKLLMGTESRSIYHMSTEAAMLSLVAIARLNPEGDIQPRARNDVARTIMVHNAMDDIIGLCVVPVETASNNNTNARTVEEAQRDFRWETRCSIAAIRLLVACLPRVDEEGTVPDEQTLEVEALRAVVDKTADGKFLTLCAKNAIGPLIRVLLLSGARSKRFEEEKTKKKKKKKKKKKGDDDDDDDDMNQVPAFALPDLLVAVSFGLSRICCTVATATMAYKKNIIPALAKVVPTIPRLGMFICLCYVYAMRDVILFVISYFHIFFLVKISKGKMTH